MIYEGQICRGPMERSSFMLPVAVGCSYNRCRFCNLFKHLKYRQLPMEQVEEEILRVQALGGDPETVFLGDGNAFGLETGHLLEIAGKIRRSFPSCRSINMDATVTNIRLKSDEELRALAAAGVGHLYLGIESGLDDVLGTMEKDHTLEQAYEQIQRLRAAGLIYDAHIMTGIAGRGRGLENAEATAEFFNRTRPERIINFSLFLMAGTPLYEDAKAGRFFSGQRAGESGGGAEACSLWSGRASAWSTMDFTTVSPSRCRGRLPGEKEKMLGKLDGAIKVWKEKEPVFAWAERIPDAVILKE